MDQELQAATAVDQPEEEFDGEKTAPRYSHSIIGAPAISSWQLVGTVMQDDVLLAGSIADNISFFDVDTSYSRVEHCATLAAFHDEIAAMPMGYQTLVGDMGTSLSGGQKQRIFLARALYKQPKILVLDEATSHLNINNEKRVNSVLAAMKLTRVMVAHRPETIAAAERVLEVKHARVEELRSEAATPV